MPDFIGPSSVLGIIGIFFLPWIAVITILIVLIQRSHDKRRMEHQERMAAIHKGYDIPSEPPAGARPRYPYAWPFVFMGFGTALLMIWVFSGFDEGASLGFGFISFFIGLALYLSRRHVLKGEQMDIAERKAREEAAVWRAPEASTPAAPAAAENPSPEKDLERFAPPPAGEHKDEES